MITGSTPMIMPSQDKPEGFGGSGMEADGGNAMEQTTGSDYLYTPSGRSSMINRRNRFRDLGAYN